jgi:O-antigen biosynthesis protein WbqV
MVLLIRAFKITARAAIRVVALAAAYYLATSRLEPISIPEALEVIGPYCLLFAIVGFLYDQFFRVGRAAWRFTSLHDVLVVVRNSTLTVVILLLAVFIFDRAMSLPRSSLVLTWVFDIGLYTSLLLARRAVHEKALAPAFAPFLGRGRSIDQTPVLMLGELNEADAFLRDNERDAASNLNPVGLICPGAADVGRGVRGVEVLASLSGGERWLREFAEMKGERAILFLDQSISPADIDSVILGQLRSNGARLYRRARLIDLQEGAKAKCVKEFDFEELLSRPPVKLDVDETRQLVSGRRILVTGAGGSIGSEICRQVAALGCAHIGLLDHSESAVFDIESEIRERFPTLSHSTILCDVRDSGRVNASVSREQPEVIFHAAALKHVPMMESHPCESVLTNVVGTWNVAEAARMNGVGNMVFISTDKAVDPSNVMGATKRLGESVVKVHRAAGSKTRFSIVRFGNVLGSTGSVVPTFRAQIERGGPITLTHPDVERFFMTIPEAVQLVLHATAKSFARPQATQSGTFVLDMGQPVKIIELARRLIALHGKVAGADIEIVTTGLRPGEKLTEELVDSTEEARPCGPGVLEVIDHANGAQVDRSVIARLHQVAIAGDDDEARSLIFDILEKLRMGDSIRRITSA